jgi:uncharacterized phage protein (TIGR01671 family)
MREIKFRGKDSLGKWLYGLLFQYEDGACSIFYGKFKHIGYEDNEMCDREEVFAHTVGQYTGLKDKNDKEIYEGDIIHACDAVGVVEFACGCFGINWDYNSPGRHRMFGVWGQRHNLRRMDDDIIYELEVIGNIYDNPELIK